MKKGIIFSITAAALTFSAAAYMAGSAHAAPSFSCNTAKLIVPWGAGGGTDVVYRIVAEAVNKSGAKPGLQVVNIGGQGGNKGAKEAKKNPKQMGVHSSLSTKVR